MKKSMQFTYYAKIVLNIIAYVLFFVFAIGFAIYGDVENKYIWVAICLIFGLLALLYEILRFWFDAATKALVFDGKPGKAYQLLSNVDKFDLNKTFRSSTIMMRLLTLIDMRDFEELKKRIASISEEKEDIQKDYDVNLVKEYANMILYGETHDKGKMKTAYRKLTSLKDEKTKKGKSHKGAYYFNWEVVNATAEYYDENYEAAYRKLNAVTTENMNKREAMHYYIVKADACKKVNKPKEAEEYFDTAIKCAQNNQIITDYINSIR